MWSQRKVEGAMCAHVSLASRLCFSLPQVRDLLFLAHELKSQQM